MIKKEISEIKKTLKPEDCSIGRICGCYVYGEDRERSTFETLFHSLPEDDVFKYADLLKKTLSGKIGKNLFNVSVGKDRQKELDELVHTELKDETKLEEFYDAVIDAYGETAENYVILLIHDNYDVPGVGSEGDDMDDASDTVYPHILCAVCPVTLTEPGLAYTNNGKAFESVSRSWVIDNPVAGFLFPAFNERCADVNEVLYYSKNAKQLNSDFVYALFDGALPSSAGEQKEALCSIVEQLCGETTFETACSIKESIDAFREEKENEERPDEIALDHSLLCKIIQEASEDDISEDDFKRAADGILKDDEPLFAENLSDPGVFEIKTPTATVKVNTKEASTPEIKKIDGRNCIVVPIDGEVLVNGIAVRP